MQSEKQGREDATAAVMKLQTVIEMVREEMEASQDAYTRCDPGNGHLLAVEAWCTGLMYLSCCGLHGTGSNPIRRQVCHAR